MIGPIGWRIGQMDDGVAVFADCRIRRCGVAISRTANRQHDFLQHQRSRLRALLLVDETHAEIDILDRAAQRARDQLKTKVGAREAALEPVDARHQPVGRKGRRHREGDGLHPAPPRFEFAKAGLDATETVGNAAVKLLALVREHRALGGALEQLAPDMRFKARQHAADGRLRDVQFGGGARETSASGGRLEDEQRIAGREHAAEF